MDFGGAHERIVHGLPCYRYEPLDPALLPPLYLAHHQGFSEPTEVFHNDVRERYLRGDETGRRRHAARRRRWRRRRERRSSADAAAAGGPHRRELRGPPQPSSTCRPGRCRWSTPRRACGASANFAGSGGAVVGTYEGDETLDALRTAFSAISCRVVTPGRGVKNPVDAGHGLRRENRQDSGSRSQRSLRSLRTRDRLEIHLHLGAVDFDGRGAGSRRGEREQPVRDRDGDRRHGEPGQIRPRPSASASRRTRREAPRTSPRPTARSRRTCRS